MKKIELAILIAAGAALWTAPESSAISSLKLTQGGNTVFATDGVLNDQNPDAGVVTYLGGVGTFGINVTTGLEIGGDSSVPFLLLNSVDVSAGSGGTLKIQLSEIGYSPLPTINSLMASIGGTLAPGAKITYNIYADASNTLFGHGTLLSSQTFTGSSFAGDTPVSIDGFATPFSLTLEAILVHPRGTKASSFGAMVNAVPDGGATGALFGSSMLLLGAFRRGKKRP